MAKKKYFYNPDTCTYEPIGVRKSDILIGSVAFGVVVIICAVLLTLLFNTYFDTDSERKIKNENNGLMVHLSAIQKEQLEIEQMLAILQQRDQFIHQAIYENNSEKVNPALKGTLENISKDIQIKGLTEETAVSFSEKVNQLNDLAINDLGELTRLAKKKLSNAEYLQYIPTLQPINNSELNLLVSGFGKRMNPYHHGIMDHHGVDFTAPVGTEVFSTGKGTVKSVHISEAKTGYGNRIDIDHGNGLVSRYTHLQDINVKMGDIVNKGETIGTTGNTGGTIAPSLHYEILRNNNRVNPVNFFIQNISERDFLVLLELSSRQNQSLD